MRQLKYILECTGYGVLVAIVVHGMIILAARLTTGVWLNEGGKYWYAFVASVAMFGSLYALFDTKVSNKKWHQYKYARYLLFSLFVVFPAIIWSSYKLNYSGPLKLTVIAERQPLYVFESDGAIQNKYVLKLVNETDQDLHISFSATSDMKEQSVLGVEAPLLIKHGKVNEYTIFIKVPEKYVSKEITHIDFKVQSTEDPTIQAKYRTVFNGPKK
jgi:polyferredoxin